ncbi:hypothetical protein CWC18_20920, partial [Pseudoalteromonas aurantia]|uniref:Eco57I restriction-modification methylase domain-containing protein n=1 Tax=Pseudoalteromonas aurantia TaxID=43654 RepID=UPI00110B1340
KLVDHYSALIKGINTQDKEVTCVDIDSNRLMELKSQQVSDGFNFLNGDFLNIDFRNKKFDFILCNPPFNAKKQFSIDNKKIPIEAAFLEKSLKLCKQNGRLIFILPSSVTRGTRLKWFRNKVLQECNLAYSYKLPKFTFSKVEGDFSVLVLDKGKNKKYSIFRNDHSEIKCTDLASETDNLSFDADELMAIRNFKSLVSKIPLAYKALNELIHFSRGQGKIM